MAVYAEVIDGKITRKRTTTDALLIQKLEAHGWRPLVNQPPEYDADTQHLGDVTFDFQEDQIVESREVVNWTEEELAANLASAKASKLWQLYANIKRFIITQPNGFPRYDDDLKMNVMNAIIIAMAAGDPEPEACTAVKNWIFTVQSEFFALKAAINAAETPSAVSVVDVSVDTLEEKYGREGTELADPAISTDDLF